ncbi:type IV secretory system conjugative DNA transfer family protein [Streptomyces boninensis]|uniref:type IV secretory system conjugative DNA transfer family protein n=1 Tax=Streptomyces boninensis TaxID=2039455 RepID=UPI003B21CFA1
MRSRACPSLPLPGASRCLRLWLPGDGIKPIGHTDIGPRRAVGLTAADARQHLHVLGATGSGKSTLIANLALHDVDQHRGVIVIDPKGDLVTDILARLPESCADRLVILDPGDLHPPPCLNVLDGGAADVVVDNVTGIFARIFAAFWGPRTDDVMRAACLTLLAYARAANRPVTLADIPRLLGEPAFRHRMLPMVKDPVLRGFWSWYETLSEPTRATVIGPVMNKLRAFLLRDFARRALTAGASTFHLPDILAGGILLARLPKGALGEETTRLLGSFVVAKTWQAAAARAHTPEHARTDASLYIDEAHNFLTLPYPLEDMLAEARGYRLSLTLAHQNLAQLPRDLREGISANARNKIFFNASPEDAAVLERHSLPALTAHDLAHLGRYQAAARLVADGAETAAFTFTTTQLPAPAPGRATALRAAAADRTSQTPSRLRPARPSHER